ncbi:MAG: type II toxin-antitoxin system HicA family toxin [Nitrospirae bacterium]|uniref:type II toxin-antitoxin system HicA family toxin n=1 Tax=Candidatus Magnetobacterium casense TaxID=1455061 RepID=UPI00058BC6B8|nr:type II toxin-antitoxin system HicA family toxin [Candidatus Magnetobacterium casensis]MBF0338041.1 type II toxin-antitoxin system HicA family toxin [Nitrospirota bacterium]
MSKLKKLLKKVKNNPDNVRFDDLCKLTKSFNFILKDKRGSHCYYEKENVNEILNYQNKNGMAKPYQVKQFIKLIEKHKMEE